MRILIVCDFFVKYGSQQARSLVNVGHEVALLVRSHSVEFGGSAAEREEALDALRRDGIQSFAVPGRVRSLSAVPKLLEIRRQLRRWGPEIVHAHENYDPRLVALTSGYRTVFTVHDPVQHLGARPLGTPEERIFKQWFRRAERFVVHSDALAEELAPIVGRSRIVVIPHGLSPRPEPLPPPESPSALLFGRLEQYKGVEVLVEAMRLVWRHRPGIRLVVAGAGPAAGLVPDDERVSLLPKYIPESEVEELLAEASLMVLPYTQASQSGVGALAIGAGLPVVVSDLGALPELAHDSSFVCEAGNPRALAETILRHLDDGAEVRRAVLRHAQAHFSWDRVAQLSTALYQELTRNGL
jgi:glycosyltransferase involved in cell wall biosynthesis